MPIEKNEYPRIIRVKETDSTNRMLHDLAVKEALPEGSVVIADFQTAGKGQIGNRWESEAGKNLTFSLLILPEFLPANRQFLISQITSLSIKETLDVYVPSVSIKWPNDIYWEDRKICGMLIENDLSGQYLYRSVIGIGLNINQKSFKSDAPNPVSLVQIIGRESDRDRILDRFLQIFFQYYCRLIRGETDLIHAAYMKALYRRTGFHSYADANACFEAEIRSIDETGHLILCLPDGELRRFAFKEVTALLPSSCREK